MWGGDPWESLSKEQKWVIQDVVGGPLGKSPGRQHSPCKCPGVGVCLKGLMASRRVFQEEERNAAEVREDGV